MRLFAGLYASLLSSLVSVTNMHAAEAAPQPRIAQPVALVCTSGSETIDDRETLTIEGAGGLRLTGRAIYSGSAPGTGSFSWEGNVRDVSVLPSKPGCQSPPQSFVYVRLSGTFSYNFRGSGVKLHDTFNKPFSSVDIRYSDETTASLAAAALRCAALHAECDRSGVTYEDFFDRDLDFTSMNGCNYRTHMAAYARVTLPDEADRVRDGDAASIVVDLHPGKPEPYGSADALGACTFPSAIAEKLFGTAIVQGGKIQLKGTTAPDGRYSVDFSGSLSSALILGDVQLKDTSLPGPPVFLAGLLSRVTGFETAPAGWDDTAIHGDCVDGVRESGAACDGAAVRPVDLLTTASTITLIQAHLDQFEAEWHRNGATFALMRQVLLSIDPNASATQEEFQNQLLSVLDAVERSQQQYRQLKAQLQHAPQSVPAVGYKRFASTVASLSVKERVALRSPAYQSLRKAVVGRLIARSNVVPPNPTAEASAVPRVGAASPIATAPAPCTQEQRIAYRDGISMLRMLESSGDTTNVQRLRDALAGFPESCK